MIKKFIRLVSTSEMKFMYKTYDYIKVVALRGCVDIPTLLLCRKLMTSLIKCTVRNGTTRRSFVGISTHPLSAQIVHVDKFKLRMRVVTNSSAAIVEKSRHDSCLNSQSYSAGKGVKRECNHQLLIYVNFNYFISCGRHESLEAQRMNGYICISVRQGEV